MLRTRQHNLAFDLAIDPLEQKNLLGHADTSDRETTVESLRELALDGFDFDATETLRLRPSCGQHSDRC